MLQLIRVGMESVLYKYITWRHNNKWEGKIQLSQTGNREQDKSFPAGSRWWRSIFKIWLSWQHAVKDLTNAPIHIIDAQTTISRPWPSWPAEVRSNKFLRKLWTGELPPKWMSKTSPFNEPLTIENNSLFLLWQMHAIDIGFSDEFSAPVNCCKTRNVEFATIPSRAPRITTDFHRYLKPMLTSSSINYIYRIEKLNGVCDPNRALFYWF